MDRSHNIRPGAAFFGGLVFDKGVLESSYYGLYGCHPFQLALPVGPKGETGLILEFYSLILGAYM